MRWPLAAAAVTLALFITCAPRTTTTTGGDRFVTWFQPNDSSVEEELPQWLEDSEAGPAGRSKRNAHRDRYGVEGPIDGEGDPISREQARGMAAEAGLLGVLKSSSGPGNARGSTDGLDRLLRDDPTASMGALLGAQPTSLGTSDYGRRAGRTHRARLARRPSTPALRQGVLASTFVAGTGVKTRLADLLDRGVRIDGKQVRLGAFEDRDWPSYPLPSDEALGLHAELERSYLHTGAERVHLQISLLAHRGEAPRRPPLHVHLLLDASGSMADEGKWQHAQKAAHGVLEQLAPGDRFALTTYADDARTHVAFRVNAARRRHARDVIDRLRPGGGTNLEAGLRLVEAKPPHLEAPGVGLVIVISDGQVNAGLADPMSLGALSRGLFDEHGVVTTTIGLGTGFNEELMLGLAREGAGSYHFVRHAADVAAALDRELRAHVEAVAQALRLRVKLADGVSVSRLYGSRLLSEREHARVRRTERMTDNRLAGERGIAADRQKPLETGLRMHIPSFRRGQQHTILLELDVPEGVGMHEVANVSLDYKDLLSATNGRAEAAVGVGRVEDRAQAAASLQRRVKRTVLAFQAGAALQDAADALRASDRRAATRLLEEHALLLMRGADRWRDPALRKDAALLRRYRRAVDGGWEDLSYQDRTTLALAMGYYGDHRMR